MLLRICIIWGGAALAFVSLDQGLLAAPHRLTSHPKQGELEEISVRYEVGGKLTVPGEKQDQSLPLHVESDLAYQQRWLEIADRPAANTESTVGQSARMRAVRHYDRIDTKLVINGQKILPELRPQRRLMVASIAAGELTLFSPAGPLARDELDLANLPGDRLVLELLLPPDPVETGARWEHDGATIAMLFGLDAVGQTDVSSVLTQVTPRHAIVELSGTVQGAVEGVASDIEMKARYYFDLQSQSIVSFQLVTKESREIGHVTPGVDVVAKLKVQIAPRSHSTELHEIGLAELELEPSAALTQFEFAPQHGRFRFLHDRKWHVTADEGNQTILRRMDRGDLIAQSKITAADPLAGKATQSLEQYTQDVKKAVGENFGRIVNADQSRTAGGATVYRVEVAGQVSELQIRWRYYLVTAADGRRVSAVFTMEEELGDRFGEADRPILESLEFLKPAASIQRLDPTPLD